MQKETIKQWAVGEPIWQKRLNQLVRGARTDIVGDKDIKVDLIGGIVYITHRQHEWDWFPAKIQTTSSDFCSDPIYRVRRLECSVSDQQGSDLLTWEDYYTVPSDWEVLAQNLAESDYDHHLAPGQVVTVFRGLDKSSPPRWRHFMCEPPRDVTAYVSSSASDNSNPTTRWTYTCSRVRKTGTGYGISKWTTWGSDFQAHNTAENANTSDSLGGIDTAHFKLSDAGAWDYNGLPIPNGTIVKARRYQVTHSDVEWWITCAGYVNNVDGECPEV